jgi:hypothetical protein
VHLVGAIRRGDKEDEVGGAVRRSEVDGRIRAGHRERRLEDGRRPAMRDGDPPGDSRVRFLFASPGVGEQRFDVGGTSFVDDFLGERADDAGAVAAEVDVEGDELWGDE